MRLRCLFERHHLRHPRVEFARGDEADRVLELVAAHAANVKRLAADVVANFQDAGLIAEFLHAAGNLVAEHHGEVYAALVGAVAFDDVMVRHAAGADFQQGKRFNGTLRLIMIAYVDTAVPGNQQKFLAGIRVRAAARLHCSARSR